MGSYFERKSRRHIKCQQANIYQPIKERSCTWDHYIRIVYSYVLLICYAFTSNIRISFKRHKHGNANSQVHAIQQNIYYRLEAALFFRSPFYSFLLFPLFFFPPSTNYIIVIRFSASKFTSASDAFFLLRSVCFSYSKSSANARNGKSGSNFTKNERSVQLKKNPHFFFHFSKLKCKMYVHFQGFSKCDLTSGNC